ADLVGRKRAALTAILDMEDERDAGKLSDVDFAALRHEYEAEAAAALVELDALRGSGGTIDESLEAEIAAIRARLQDDSPRAAASLEECPTCGTPRVPGRTCERCGT
ncbi:MAG TPA: 50S ribosomal protein L32, partial [Actinomycetota bacterium]